MFHINKKGCWQHIFISVPPSGSLQDSFNTDSILSIFAYLFPIKLEKYELKIIGYQKCQVFGSSVN